MSTQTVPGAVTEADQQSWHFQQSYIERLMDHSALTSAHPDDTLLMAGPPRYTLPTPRTSFDGMLPLGMMQQMQVTQQLPVTPGQAIGSGRSFYLIGKAQGNASVARLFVNGRNLLRALMTNAVQAGIDPTAFDDPAAETAGAQFYANLDSEMFRIPFGMGVIFRDKIHNEIGAFYLELCQITTWALAIGAGQAMILENVTLLYDRLLPISAMGVGDAPAGYANHPQDAKDSPLFQAVFQVDGAVETSPEIDIR